MKNSDLIKQLSAYGGDLPVHISGSGRLTKIISAQVTQATTPESGGPKKKGRKPKQQPQSPDALLVLTSV